MKFYSYGYNKILDICINNIVQIDDLKNKSILVTGCTGLIGSFLIDVLYKLNVEFDYNIKIYCMGRSIDKFNKRFSFHDKIIFLKQDIALPFELDMLLDYILHAASNAHPAVIENDPVGTIHSNIVGTTTFLEYCKRNKCRFIFVSSGEVYGNYPSGINNWKEHDCGIITSLNKRSCYPLSKKMSENMCVAYKSQFDVDICILRPCHIFGPNITSEDSRASAQFFNNIINEENILMKSSGKQVRSYLYIPDCVSAIFTVIINGKSGEVYNISGDDYISISGFSKKIAEISGVDIIFEESTNNDVFIANQILCNEKLRHIGWKQHFTIVQGIIDNICVLKERN